MVPTVAQQLQSVRRTLAATVLPSIDADASFAREQAGLVLATLDWILDVQASEYRYETVELDDATALVAAFHALDPDATDGEADPAPATPADPAVPTDLTAIRARVLAAKQAAEAAFVALSPTDHADEAWRLMSAAARRQAERELAWARMTGFPKGVTGSVAEVLDRQASQETRA